MESKSRHSGVLRRLPPSLRYYPYASSSGRRSGFGKDDTRKEEVVRLGVELSLHVAESMFLLSDDIRSMLLFCAKLWRDVEPASPVVERLLLVMHYVYSKDDDINKPKNGGKLVHPELIRTTYMDFVDGIRRLHRLFLAVRNNSSSYFDDRLAIAKYKQVLMKLDDKLRHVSEANGFARKTIESNIFDLWRSLFDEEAGEAKVMMKHRIIIDLFTPLFDQSRPLTSGRSETRIHYFTYSLGMGFAKQELRDEAVQLGVELSLYVAESMFLLCDDIRTMLVFCFILWRNAIRYRNHDSPVVERLLRVIHYVYSKYIKPMNGVYHDGGNSVHWELMRRTTWKDFADGIEGLEDLVLTLRGEGSCVEGTRFKSSIREALRKVEEKLRSVKAVSEANGFAREAMEPNILDMWKSVLDKEAKEATQTLKVINNRILSDLFLPLWNEAI
ncbi:hypothetical protein ISN45_Aa02g000330 [Arabidopsis thaliana x Arabidopsis arenosa]|uniref:Uncharacterized protein n=1 Tax=Arabidopsis thaliana x Arabidopsis arenosa TaxID=1240361 RepID=A0A8T2BGP7_9BRAS|nr:hypothetical protein ISN45_Aa02g000330 [Arabidopsis thaliana x Arabidopsis arenosa]